MEAKLNCLLMLPLREMALRKIAVVLGNKPEFLATFERIPVQTFHHCSYHWQGILWRQVERTVSQLPLPASLEKEMKPLLKGVGSEILEWKFFHYEYLGKVDGHAFEEFCWTSAGAIDYPKTAAKLVRSDALDIVQRFIMACIYCLEDSIPTLWNEVPLWSKRRICKGADPPQTDSPNFLLFLPYIFGKSNDCCFHYLRDIRSDCFKHSGALGNIAAAKYYLKNLTVEEKEAALSAEGVSNLYFSDDVKFRCPDVLSYFLSLMTPGEQHRIFMQRPREVLACFLNWPWQDLFLDIADVVWTCLDEPLCADLFFNIKDHVERTGYYLPNFIQKLFLRSPKKFRQVWAYFEIRNPFFFEKFFHQEDFESIRVILGNIDTIAKEKLLISRKFLRLFDDFLLNDQWQIVEGCIQNAMLSKKYKGRLKVAFEKFVTIEESGTCKNLPFPDAERTKDNRKRFFDFLDGRKTITAKKRTAEEEITDVIKKLCIEEEK